MKHKIPVLVLLLSFLSISTIKESHMNENKPKGVNAYMECIKLRSKAPFLNLKCERTESFAACIRLKRQAPYLNLNCNKLLNESNSVKKDSSLSGKLEETTPEKIGEILKKDNKPISQQEEVKLRKFMLRHFERRNQKM